VPKVLSDTGFAAPTPATDGRRVYAGFANGDLAAFDFTGKLAWSKSLGIPKNDYGHGTSLAMFGKLLLVQYDQGIPKERLSKLIALDGATGKPVWETPRPDMPSSWSTPIVIDFKGRQQIITAGDPWAIGYDPDGGKELWRAKCLRQDVAPSPVFADGIVYFGHNAPYTSAIRPDGQGDVTETHVLWKAEDNLPDTCSPLATPQWVFLLTSSGTLTCYDAKSGKKLKDKDFDSSFQASPSLANKNLYLFGAEGKVFLLGADPASWGKTVAETDMKEPCAASPAFQNGRIFVRTKSQLICIGKK
jgi:outer membrane protein assembly factor BamB